MQIQENVALSSYSTMRLGGPAHYLVEVYSRQELVEAVTWAENKQLMVIAVGIGSNIIWDDAGFPGLVIVNRIPGFDVFEMDAETVYVTIGAGENWDSVVERTVNLGLSGIEQLSLIPGTTGATPVQNVGAYGREISDVLTTLEAYDKLTKQVINIRGSDCGFGYRTSRFKTSDRGRFFITSLTLSLTRTQPQPPFYESVQRYLQEQNITEITASTIRQAVIAIRSSKLPDPAVVANNGSFFANPIISRDALVQIQMQYPDIPYWQTNGGVDVKIPAGWLIEQCGLKGIHDEETGMATWDKQALVLVNEHAKSTQDLLKFREKIMSAVREKFGITLVQEPELI